MSRKASKTSLGLSAGGCRQWHPPSCTLQTFSLQGPARLCQGRFFLCTHIYFKRNSDGRWKVKSYKNNQTNPYTQDMSLLRIQSPPCLQPFTIHWTFCSFQLMKLNIWAFVFQLNPWIQWLVGYLWKNQKIGENCRFQIWLFRSFSISNPCCRQTIFFTNPWNQVQIIPWDLSLCRKKSQPS